MSFIPPNPDELATEHASALAEEAMRVFAYLARIAQAAAEVAAHEAEEAEMLAPLADDPEDATEAAERVFAMAERADAAADRAHRAEYLAGRHGVLGHVAEDIEPEAVAEVALALAEAMAAALEGVTRRV